MIKNAMSSNEGKKRKRRDSEEEMSKSKVNFTRTRCYNEVEDVEDDIGVADGQMSNMHIES